MIEQNSPELDDTVSRYKEPIEWPIQMGKSVITLYIVGHITVKF